VREDIGFYKRSGITLLRDSTISLDEFVLIGRDDYTNKHRKTLQDIMKQSKPVGFTILLDHQPQYLDEAVNNEIDFQFSGHTHYGQIFPASLITNGIFELSHGYKQKGNTHFYVSSGIGIWGGKFRIGTRSEYLVLDLKPSK
jgi:predicted MPP superfamily phosphohydrolase